MFDSNPQDTARALREIPTELLANLIERKGTELYVVITKDGRSVLKDPGLNRPYTVPQKKMAELVAREADGVVVTLGEAIDILTRNARPND